MEIKTLYDLGDRQRAVIELLWSLDGATAWQVWQRLGRPAGLAYTTVLSTLQKLEASGWLRHERAGRRHRYRVATGRPQAARAATRKFVERVYGGDPTAFSAELVDGRGRRPSLRRLVDFRRGVA